MNRFDCSTRHSPAYHTFSFSTFSSCSHAASAVALILRGSALALLLISTLSLSLVYSPHSPDCSPLRVAAAKSAAARKAGLKFSVPYYRPPAMIVSHISSCCCFPCCIIFVTDGLALFSPPSLLPPCPRPPTLLFFSSHVGKQLLPPASFVFLHLKSSYCQTYRSPRFATPVPFCPIPPPPLTCHVFCTTHGLSCTPVRSHLSLGRIALRAVAAARD